MAMQRKLAAILSADVVGYSGLMEADEAGTLERLKANRRDVFDPCVAKHGGRIVKLMGDGALIEFASVVAAVECAVALQAAMANATDQSIRYRIGVNLGDVIIEGDDIYGEGVNVAARLQALAPEGGVAISRTVRDNIEGKIAATFQDLGEHAVKNIQRPVHVFALGAPGPKGQPLQQNDRGDRISICVLPFANISGDIEQEYFSDGISEDIITDLSKVSALWVAARNTAFQFKGKHVDAPQLARQLKVTHILEGSVRKAGNRVRITAQLIDASGGHVWAERYDRDLNDIFALQDEISEAIVKALKLKLLPEEKKAIEQRGTTNPKAYKLYLMARQFVVSGNIGSVRRNEAIIRLCRRATELDPTYARPWAAIAGAQASLRIFVGRSGDVVNGLEAAERAIALDPNLAEAHAVRAEILASNGRQDEADREIELALKLDPDAYEVNNAVARAHFSARRIAEATRHWEKATTSMEGDYHAAGMLLTCYDALGDKVASRRAAERALARAERVVASEPDNGSAMSFIVTALGVLEEKERAIEWIERGTLLDPNNHNMYYNFACTLSISFHDAEGAIDLLTGIFAIATIESMNWMKVDPDLDPLREHPRFKQMMVDAEARIAVSPA